MLSQACLQCTNGKFCRAFVFRIRSFCPLEKSLNSPLSQFHSGLIICIKSLLLQLNYTLGTESQWFLEWELEGKGTTEMQFCQMSHKISFLTSWEDLEILIWRDWSQPQQTGDCLSKETGNKNCHKVASQRRLGWAAAALTSSLSAISHIIGVSVEQRSDFGSAV